MTSISFRRITIICWGLSNGEMQAVSLFVLLYYAIIKNRFITMLYLVYYLEDMNYKVGVKEEEAYELGAVDRLL